MQVQNNKDGSGQKVMKNSAMFPDLEISDIAYKKSDMYHSNNFNQKSISPKFTKAQDINNMCNFFSNQNLNQSITSPTKSLKALKNLNIEKSRTELDSNPIDKKQAMSQRSMNPSKGISSQHLTKKSISIKR